MIKILKAILEINPNAQVSVEADNIDKITWHGDTTPISKEDILAKQAELQTDYDACLLYTSPSPRDKRQSRMPSSA